MSKRILVVNSAPATLKKLCSELRRARFTVTTAMDGRMALLRARTDHPNLILLDIELPELNGLEVCRELKRNDKTDGIPIIIISDKTSEIDRILALEFGADDYLLKPVSCQELILKIQLILEIRPEHTKKRRGRTSSKQNLTMIS